MSDEDDRTPEDAPGPVAPVKNKASRTIVRVSHGAGEQTTAMQMKRAKTMKMLPTVARTSTLLCLSANNPIRKFAIKYD